ncbi:FHA domain-containing protein [Candidatus Gracilibacteria bacterium]|nr:FHA domain-containing protein [Candidatus Gracilibacteria bacterium]
MQRCPNCNVEQFDGTIFCADCGAGMQAVQRRETTTALNKASGSGSLPNVVEDTATITPVASDARMHQIVLVVINSGRRIEVDVRAAILVGRKDHTRGIFPDIDLGLDGGYDAGVSRKHAIISTRDGGYMLEDLASANGTFINGRKLAAQTPTALHNGDEVKFGTLILRYEEHGAARRSSAARLRRSD